MNPERNVKYKKCFCRYISCKRKRREKVGLLLNMVVGLVTKDRKRPRYLVLPLPKSLLVRPSFRNPRPLRPMGKSGVQKT